MTKFSILLLINCLFFIGISPIFAQTREEVEKLILYSRGDRFWDDRLPSKEKMIARFKEKHQVEDIELVALLEDYLHYWPEDEQLTRCKFSAVIGTWGAIGHPRGRENIIPFVKDYKDEDPIEQFTFRQGALMQYLRKHNEPIDELISWVLREANGPYDIYIKLEIYRYWKRLSEEIEDKSRFNKAIPKIVTEYREVNGEGMWLTLDETLENLGLIDRSDIREIRKRRADVFMSMGASNLSRRSVEKLRAIKDKYDTDNGSDAEEW